MFLLYDRGDDIIEDREIYSVLLLIIISLIVIPLAGIYVKTDVMKSQAIEPNLFWSYQMIFDPEILTDLSQTTEGTALVHTWYTEYSVFRFVAELDPVAERPIVIDASSHFPPPALISFNLEQSTFLDDYGFLYVWKYDYIVYLEDAVNEYIYITYETTAYYDGRYIGAVGYDGILWDDYGIGYFYQEAGGDW